MLFQRLWLVVVATGVLLCVSASAQSGWSGGGSGDDVEKTKACVRPPGAPSQANQTVSIADALLLARCLAICLQERTNGDIPAHVNNGYSYIREVDLESDCNLYNQVYDCARGCVVGKRTQDGTECSQECTLECDSRSGDITGNRGGCEEVCSLPECQNGCSYTESLELTAGTIGGLPPQPPKSLQLMKDFSTPIGVYDVSAPYEDSWPILIVPLNTSFVTFLIQVEEIEQGETFYIVKTGLPSRLNLNFLSCEDVVISHCLVNQYGRSPFSPQSSTLFVEGVQVVQPTAVTDVQISYTYDTRPGFFGHYCMNLNWTSITDPLSVSHFQVEIAQFSTSCGTSIQANVYPVLESPTEATVTTLCASSEQSAPISRCTYIVVILTYPAVDIFEVVQSPIVFTSTPVYEPDDLIVECNRWLNNDNLFTVNLTVQLSEYLSNERVISSFVLLVMQDTVFIDGTIDQLTLLSPYKRTFLQVSSVFKETISGLSPHSEDNIQYTIALVPEWNSIYTPNSEAYYCSVEAQSPRPDPILDITVNNLAIRSSNLSFTLSVMWEEPNTFNGEFVQYQIVVGPTSLLPNSTDIQNVSAVINVLKVDQREFEQQFSYSPEDFCYYLQIRSFNSYLPSNWSEPVVLILDQRCEHYVPSSDVITTSSVSSSDMTATFSVSSSDETAKSSIPSSSSPMATNEGIEFNIQLGVYIAIALLVILVTLVSICVMIASYWMKRSSAVTNQASDFNHDWDEKGTGFIELEATKFEMAQ